MNRHLLPPSGVPARRVPHGELRASGDSLEYRVDCAERSENNAGVHDRFEP